MVLWVRFSGFVVCWCYKVSALGMLGGGRLGAGFAVWFGWSLWVAAFVVFWFAGLGCVFGCVVCFDLHWFTDLHVCVGVMVLILF